MINYSELATRNTFKDRIEYCNTALDFIGQGSDRRVYRLGDGNVFKLAKRSRGLEQNKREQELAAKSDLVAQVLYYVNSSAWVIAQECTKVTAKEFKNRTGLGWYVFCRCLRTAVALRNDEDMDQEAIQEYERYADNEFLKAYSTFVYESRIMLGDVIRLNSWGVTLRKPERLVLVDYGMQIAQ